MYFISILNKHMLNNQQSSYMFFLISSALEAIVWLVNSVCRVFTL